MDCHRFLRTFTSLGTAEKAKARTKQLNKQRESERNMSEEHERKMQETLNKTLHEVDFNSSETDRDNALRKMIEAATKVS